MLNKTAPLLFAFLWSTGFPSATAGMQYAEPMTFLSIRMVIVTLMFLMIILFQWKKYHFTFNDAYHAGFIGLLLHGFYLGGVFYAVKSGLPAPIAALIVSSHPILSSSLAWIFLKEKLELKQIIGLLLGFCGVVIVISQYIDDETMISFSNEISLAILACLGSLISIAYGLLHQKKYTSNIPVMISYFWQYAFASIFFIIMSFSFETQYIEFHPVFFISMAWLVIMLSIVSIGLLMYMLKNKAVSNVSSLFYLVPSFSFIEGYVLFGETFSWVSLFGVFFTMIGVALVMNAKWPFKKA